MRPICELDPAALAGIRGVFTDIDETLSTRGRLTAEAYAALWRLHDAGFLVVPVTGRSAGWCDHVARFWPVDAVVGENGAFYFHWDGTRLRRRFLYGDAERRALRERLRAVEREILAAVPGAAAASDQLYREADLAIDFCEDVAPLPREAVVRIREIFEGCGAHARISSIHVNGWFGDFDKRTTATLCARELFDVDLETDNGAFVFCGDSPNDEPLFRFFDFSFGMANVSEYLDLMETGPAWLCANASGAGFAEVADLLLRARGAAPPR